MSPKRAREARSWVMRAFLMERPAVRRRACSCLSWFGCEEHDCRSFAKACLVMDSDWSVEEPRV